MDKQANGGWRVQYKGKSLGSHATEEAAAQAYNSYVKDGVLPVKRRAVRASQFRGVHWVKSRGIWRAQCRGKCLGSHATEVAAARAYNTEAERIGHDDLNIIPPGYTSAVVAGKRKRARKKAGTGK